MKANEVPYTQAYDHLRSLVTEQDESGFSPPKISRSDAACLVHEIAKVLAMPTDELVRQIGMYAEGQA